MLIALAVIVAYLASMVVIGYVIFSPYRMVIRQHPTCNKRYQLTDLFAFFLSFQLGFGVISYAFPDIRWNMETAIFSVTILIIVTGLSWFYGLRILWRANVTSPLKRIILLGLVMPFGFVVPTIALPVVTFPESPIQISIHLVIVLLTTALLRFSGFWVLQKTNPAAE